MTHSYSIQGMSCQGCKNHVKNIISSIDNVEAVSVDLKNSKVNIDMAKHIPLKTLQKAFEKDGSNYSIHQLKTKHAQTESSESPEEKKRNAAYYCPMHCEDEKTYDKPGKCPVCGMYLKEKSKGNSTAEYIYTVHGMTCQGCKTHVKEILEGIDGVQDASVDLESQQAKIKVEEHIALEKLQKAFKQDEGNYAITHIR